MISKKKKTSKAKKRPYNNTTRTAKSSQTQKEIIEALVHLLAEKRGGEVQIQEVADKTGITKRTIFRFFKDKKSLHEAMDEYLLSYVSAGVRQLDALSFVEFGKNAVKAFEENESITIAYVLSPLGQEARLLFRKKLNQLMMEKIAAEKKIKITKENFPRIALIVNMVNAKVWYDLKTEHKLSGKEIEEAMGWGIDALLRNL